MSGRYEKFAYVHEIWMGNKTFLPNNFLQVPKMSKEPNKRKQLQRNYYFTICSLKCFSNQIGCNLFQNSTYECFPQ